MRWVKAVGRQRGIAAEVRGTDWLVEGTCLFTTEGTEAGPGTRPSALQGRFRKVAISETRVALLWGTL